MLIWYPPQSIKKTNIKNTKATYKMAKFEKQLFNNSFFFFFGRTLLHAHAQYIYIVNAKTLQ